jgi:membrane-associated phospholipid phosphatase
MVTPGVRMAIDYNRGQPRLVRWMLVACAWVRWSLLEPMARDPGLKHVFVPLAVGVIGFILLWPLDARLSAALQAWVQNWPGDLRRELHAWQQFGQGAALVLTAIVVIRLEPKRWRRVLDLALAVLVGQLVTTGAKLLVGRPRPRPQFEDATSFLGPWGEYPIVLKDGSTRLVRAWDLAGGATTDLWSMPSSHTFAAFVLAVFVGHLYPRLSPTVFALAALVGLARVAFDAHWPTDVLVGGVLGYVVASLTITRYAGVRLVDWLWLATIDRNARPALPSVISADRASFLGRS